MLKVLKKFFCVLFFVFVNANSLNALGPEDLTIKQKIGQMIILDIRCINDGEAITEVNDKSKLILKKLITDYFIGGIVLFKQNFLKEEQSRKLVKDLQQIAMDCNCPPLIICTDQEGGTVERFSFGRDKLKNNFCLKTKEEAYERGKKIGEELKDKSINCDFAPVLDIFSNDKNKVIGERSFGKDVKKVSEFGIEFIKGLHSQGISATAKHFPGHGDTEKDSHTSLPVVTKTFEEIKKFELKPFQAAIDAGVDLVMVAHIAFTNAQKDYFKPEVKVTNSEENTLKSKITITEYKNDAFNLEGKDTVSKEDENKTLVPATLSKFFVTDILRNEMGFKGLIITDAMNMGAISRLFPLNEAVEKAILAGNDIILMPIVIKHEKEWKDLDDLYKYLIDKFEKGEIFEKNINKSVERIFKFKEKYCAIG